MGIFEDFLRVVYVPERFNSLIPGQPENLCKESHFPSRLHIILVIEAVYFLLDNFASCFRHIDDSVKFGLEFLFISLFVIFKDLLVGMLEKTRFRTFFELFCGFLHIEELFVDNLVHFFVEIDEFS